MNILVITAIPYPNQVVKVAIWNTLNVDIYCVRRQIKAWRGDDMDLTFSYCERFQGGFMFRVWYGAAGGVPPWPECVGKLAYREDPFLILLLAFPLPHGG